MTHEKKFLILSIALIAVIFLGTISFFASYQKIMAESRTASMESISKSNALAEKNIFENTNAIDGAKAFKMPVIRAISDSDHIIGDRQAPVGITVYSDFECPFSARFDETIKLVRQEFGDKVAIAFRHYPLNFHQSALPAALASECASEQGKFWEMHDRLFQANRDNAFSSGQFRADAEALGLDMEKFDDCMQSEKYIGKIQGQLSEGKNLGIVGTPASFINGDIAPGAFPMDDYEDNNGVMIRGMRSRILKFLK